MVLQAEAEAAELETRLGEIALASDASKAWMTIEDPCLEENSACWELITGIWFNSSKIMASVARSAGAVYLHVLQPNQYVDESKRLSPEELAGAYKPLSFFGRAVRAGYPYFQDRGSELRREGIAFHDLTMLFRDDPETIYIDACCHYNRRGNQRLGEAVGRLIHEALDSRH